MHTFAVLFLMGLFISTALANRTVGKPSLRSCDKPGEMGSNSENKFGADLLQDLPFVLLDPSSPEVQSLS
jgi:hypothetical protein